MHVFISHDFDDASRFEDLHRLLNDRGISSFQPGKLLVGRGLSDQLRDELARCDVCILLATRRSINSAWCAAEMGAAWGLGKPTAVYLSDSDLDPVQVPPQLQGQLMTKSLLGLINSIQELAARSRSGQNKDIAVASSAPSSPQPLEDFRQIVRTELRRERGLVWTHETFLDLRSLLLGEKWTEKRDELGSLLLRFIGTPSEFVPNLELVGWPYAFSTYTTTGKWSGCALKETEAVPNDLTFYDKCVLLHYDEDSKVDGAVTIERVFEEYAFGAFGLYPVWSDTSSVSVGRVALGTAAPRPGQISADNYPAPKQ